MTKEKKQKGAKRRSVSTKLLLILIPIITVFIAAVTIFVAFQARDVIISRSKAELHEESLANANEISGTIRGFKEYFNSIAQTLENVSFTSDDELVKAFGFVLSKFEETYNGFYIGLDDKGYIDSSGWVPEEGYDPTSRDWYASGLGKKELTLGEPYMDASTGNACVSMSREITLADGRHGVISVDVDLAKISDAVAEYKPAGTGSAILFDGSEIIASIQKDYNATNVSEHPSDTFLNSINKVVTSGGSSEIQEIDGRYVSFDLVEGTTWTMASYVNKSDVLAEVNRFMLISLILMIVAIIIIIITMIIATRRIITSPTAILNESISHISRGEFIDMDISRVSNDEIGEMMRNTHFLMTTLRGVVTDVKGASSQLGQSAGELANTSGQMSDTTDGVSEAVQEVAKGATEQADTIQKATENISILSDAIRNVAGSAEHLASTAAAMSDASQSSAGALKELSSNMEAMEQSMEEINETMHSTNSAVQSVNEKVDGITSIASQTNLLALNASIEAARAGEAGRGFAVVAEEIGKLATESAQTAEEIRTEMSKLLSQSQNAIEKTEAVSEISSNVNTVLKNTVNQINELIEEVSVTVDDINTISGLTEECDASKVEIVDAMSSLSAISEENAASTQETSASMQELNATVNMLAGSASSLDDIAKTLDRDLQFFKI